jgi:hypothetical protein
MKRARPKAATLNSRYTFDIFDRHRDLRICNR